MLWRGELVDVGLVDRADQCAVVKDVGEVQERLRGGGGWDASLFRGLAVVGFGRCGDLDGPGDSESSPPSGKPNEERFAREPQPTDGSATHRRRTPARPPLPLQTVTAVGDRRRKPRDERVKTSDLQAICDRVRFEAER